jgi:hypothetical protein
VKKILTIVSCVALVAYASFSVASTSFKSSVHKTEARLALLDAS